MTAVPHDADHDVEMAPHAPSMATGADDDAAPADAAVPAWARGTDDDAYQTRMPVAVPVGGGASRPTTWDSPRGTAPTAVSLDQAGALALRAPSGSGVPSEALLGNDQEGQLAQNTAAATEGTLLGGGDNSFEASTDVADTAGSELTGHHAGHDEGYDEGHDGAGAHHGDESEAHHEEAERDAGGADGEGGGHWVVAAYDHQAQDEDELSLTTGCLIQVTSTTPAVGEGWWEGTNPATGEHGIFPVSYVEETSRRP